MKMMDYHEFGARAKATPLRCVALVRHGERPPIEPSDPTFGASLPLSQAGREMAEDCGRRLALSGPPPGEWAFHASSLRRTRLTAQCVADAMGADPAAVRISDEAGIPGIWVLDAAETHRHYFAEGSVPFTERFMRDGRADGYRPIAETVPLALQWLSRGFGARCAFIATHDVFAAVMLRGTGVMAASCSQWIGFLQGCAFFERPDGGWDCEYLVPDKSSWRNTFVQ